MDIEIKKNLYPCMKCGLLRTEEEGGTTFTVCDKCWDDQYSTSTTKMNNLRPIGTRFHQTYFSNSSPIIMYGHTIKIYKIVYEYEVIGYETIYEHGVPVIKEITKVIHYSHEYGEHKCEDTLP